MQPKLIPGLMLKLAARGCSSHRNAAIVGLKVQPPLREDEMKSTQNSQKIQKKKKKEIFFVIASHN